MEHINSLKQKRISLDLANLFQPMVYFLFNNDEVVYIGASRYGLARISRHKQEKIFNAFSYINCSEKEMHKIEGYYIRKFKPTLNVVGHTPKLHKITAFHRILGKNRKLKKYTYRQMGEKLGITDSAYMSIEKGIVKKITPDRIKKIAENLNIDIKKLEGLYNKNKNC